ncbi:MAG: hypothetical protein HY673_21090 [Chloroflexi bacterium]|nr:hypothetical protein [Chloroflexota bacterium]
MKRTARSLPGTNTIVRYLVNDDPALYAKSREFFDKVKDGGARAVVFEQSEGTWRLVSRDPKVSVEDV